MISTKLQNEVGSVGATFAEISKTADAYSHLLGLNKEFEKIKDNPVTVRYLEAIMNAKSSDHQDYTESVLLFSLFIEHVSLFSQF